MRCPICGTEYSSPFCPNGCDAPAAPYITQRQQDQQSCPYCGSRRIQVTREAVRKRRLFGRGEKTRFKIRRVCAECGKHFR